jgi:hypothetical protein
MLYLLLLLMKIVQLYKDMKVLLKNPELHLDEYLYEYVRSPVVLLEIIIK